MYRSPSWPCVRVLQVGLDKSKHRERVADQILVPVLVLKTCAVLLHPVARYSPSDENLTQHTTLQRYQSSASPKEELENTPLVH